MTDTDRPLDLAEIKAKHSEHRGSKCQLNVVGDPNLMCLPYLLAVRAEEAEHLVNLANAQSEVDWSHGRRLLEALKGDDDWDWGDVADNAIELAVRAEAAESKLWQHTLANGGCVPKPAYDDLGAVLNAASALKVRWLSRRDEVSAVASDPQIARISATIIETCAEELSAALAGDEVAW